MGLDFGEISGTTRQSMMDELDADETAGRLYLSGYFSDEGRDQYPALIREAIEMGNDDSLASALASPGMFASHYQKATPSGGVTTAAVPRTAATTFAQGEFNRFYIRALCLRAIDGAGGKVTVYRARESSWARPESEALIGTTLDAADLLDDLRTHIGEAPTLLPYVNSGLSVRLP